MNIVYKQYTTFMSMLPENFPRAEVNHPLAKERSHRRHLAKPNPSIGLSARGSESRKSFDTSPGMEYRRCAADPGIGKGDDPSVCSMAQGGEHE